MEQYLKILKEWISFKTVSADPDCKPEMERCAEWLSGLFREHGFETNIWQGKTANPVVFAEYKHNHKARTILIYGHYDVQPASLEDGWNSEPFTLKEGDERLYGRGVIDNKGQVLVHISSAFELIAAKKIDVNLKFLIEGDEETGSLELPEIIKEHQQQLSCDEIIISDGNLLNEHPVIEAGFRGVANITLKYRTAKTSLHSGEYGNTVPNSLHELSRLITLMFTPVEDIAIPGFYAGVSALQLPELPITQEAIKAKTGARQLFISADRNWHQKTGIFPALVVTGISGGYTGAGYANIIPDHAEARFNLRFGQGQVPEEIVRAFKEFVGANTPAFVDYELTVAQQIKAESLNTKTARSAELAMLLQKVYESPVIYKYVGGTLPIIAAFKEYLGKEPISIPLANDDSNMHGSNENFLLKRLRSGLAFSAALLGKQAAGAK